MYIPVEIQNNKLTVKDTQMTQTTFKSMNLKESDLEEFVRNNIEYITNDSETLLIVGQQVTNTEGGRSDLTAVNSQGDIVLIELKRDLEDIKQRKEPFEFQAIRYASSCSKISSIRELVDKVYGPYIEKIVSKATLGNLTPAEYAERQITNFLRGNNALNNFNKKQKIILIASQFDPQTLSAVAWLVDNNVDISCFTLTPMEMENDLYIDITKVLPVGGNKDFIVDVAYKKLSSSTGTKSGGTKVSLPKVSDMMDNDLIKVGDEVYIKCNGSISQKARIVDAKYVDLNGKKMTINTWGKEMTGWSTISIYDWVTVERVQKTIGEIRKEFYDL